MKEAKWDCGSVAAFFDLDGTLVARPSVEWRFFRSLRYKRAIRAGNYFLWLREAVHLAPQGICAMRYANKMYLRGVATRLAGLGAGANGFFAEGIERVAWHVEQKHKVFLVTGTVEPLARRATEELERAVFAQRGMATKIEVCATQLEEKHGKWTGRIRGEAMYSEAKARAVRNLASGLELDLKRSYAYGNSVQDRELLETVGKPAAVNPTRGFVRIARQKNWVVLQWSKSEILRPLGRLKKSFYNNCGQSEESVFRKEIKKKQVPRASLPMAGNPALGMTPFQVFQHAAKGLSYKLHSKEVPTIYRKKTEWESLG